MPFECACPANHRRILRLWENKSIIEEIRGRNHTMKPSCAPLRALVLLLLSPHCDAQPAGHQVSPPTHTFSQPPVGSRPPLR